MGGRDDANIEGSRRDAADPCDLPVFEDAQELGLSRQGHIPELIQEDGSVIGGLEETSRGKMLIDGEDVTDQPPSKRGLSMVFQSYALYPHMTVRENMGFSLKTAGAPKAEITEKVNHAAEVLKLESYLDRKPKALSGGQRQRVAIGRSIVREPTAFLFDEPLSNLDAALREEVDNATLWLRGRVVHRLGR